MAFGKKNTRWGQNVSIKLDIPAHYAVLVASIIKATSQKDAPARIELLKSALSPEGDRILEDVADEIMTQVQDSTT